MQIDEIIDRLHALSRTGEGYVLTDDDKRLLAIVSSQMSEFALTFESSFASKITKQSVYKSRGTSFIRFVPTSIQEVLKRYRHKLSCILVCK